MSPSKQALYPTFDLNVLTQDEHVALAFDGFIQIDAGGLFTFYLSSDDGSQLLIKTMISN